MNKAGINEDFLQWLIDQGFFTAPASRKYHGAYEGGLFDHCFEVTESLVEITEKLGIQWEMERSPYIVGMFHDLCKVDQYEKVIDIEGVTFFGMEEPKGEQSHWEYTNDSLFPGHGDKSIMKLAAWMHLTEEEILCIRYHMGAYEKDTWDYYDRAIKKYQTVLWTHTADMVASKVKGV
jgi:HD superfamily phosphohydrolase YqeK